MRIETLDRRERVIGDDWVFNFTVTDLTLSPPGPANLTGFQPGGWLNIPNSSPMPISGSMVNINNLAIGQFVFTISRGITDDFLPDNTGYSVQVFMIDPGNIQSTYLVVPLKVIQV
jgi:hypothetical protein